MKIWLFAVIWIKTCFLFKCSIRSLFTQFLFLNICDVFEFIVPARKTCWVSVATDKLFSSRSHSTMNKALRDGAFERPDLSDPQHYVREGLPGLTDRTLLPTKNIWKTIYETFPGQTRGFDLIETYPEVEDDPNQDVEWCVHQFLGSGGFGAVASWFRVNDTGDVVDEIAIKEAVDFHKRHKDNRWNGVNDGPLLREAVMHAQLNKKDGVTDLENESG